MRRLYYLVSAAAIIVVALAGQAHAQPFSEMIGSWGYGGYGAFHMVLWILILFALILGIAWRFLGRKTSHARRVSAPPPRLIQTMSASPRKADILRHEPHVH